MCTNPFYLSGIKSQFSLTGKFSRDCFFNLRKEVFTNPPFHVFDRSEFYQSFKVSCGKCRYCLIRRSALWSIRCMHEASLHDRNSFLTLTYSPDHLPSGGNLCRADIDKFLQDLRNYLRRRRDNVSFRYYYCAEYGSRTLRPHFHVLLFGYDFPDRYVYFKSKKGNLLYRDSVLDSIWSKGLAIIGDVTFQSARYVASYIFDKWKKKSRKGLVPEWSSASRMPGIAYHWISKYYSDVYSQDKVVFYVKGKPRYLPPPRYYDKFMAQNYPDQWESIVTRRILRQDFGDEFLFDYSDVCKADARDLNLSAMLDIYHRDSV